MAKPKRERLMTPFGKAVFPWITRPDTKFDADGVYKSDLQLDPEDSEVREFIDRIEAERDAFLEGLKTGEEEWQGAALKAPAKKKLHAADVFKTEYDEDEEETGNILITVKQNAVIRWTKNGKKEQADAKIGLVDAEGQPIKGGVALYGGSTVRFLVTPMPWYRATDGAVGVTLKLVACQIKELVSGDGGGDFGFDSVEGYTHTDTSKEEPTTAYAEDGEVGSPDGPAGGVDF